MFDLARTCPDTPPRTTILMSPATSLPDDNPFVQLLVSHLPDDIVVKEFSWTRAFFSRYDVLHIHWPEHLLRAGSPAKSLVKSGMLLALTLRNRLLARHVRTVHNIRPHESTSGLANWALGAWERSSSANIYLSESGRRAASTEGDRTTSTTVVHGDYGPFVASLARPEVELVSGRLLAFGYLRPYKGLEQLIEAFRTLEGPHELTLRIVGPAVPTAYGEELSRLSEKDSRISVVVGRQRDAALNDEISAAAAIVLPYQQVYNSGAALLALTLGKPIIVTDSPSMRELAAEVGPEWVRCVPRWTPSALRMASSDLPSPSRRPDLSARDWRLLSLRYAEIYRSLRRKR